MLLGLGDRLRVELGDLDRLALADPGLRLGRRRRRQQQGDEERYGSKRKRAPQAKVHSLLPMKLKGIAIATATAWAGMSPIPPRISSSRATRLIKRARTLTVKNRAAWKPAWPCRASKVQCRFHQKLFVTATQKAMIAAGMW